MWNKNKNYRGFTLVELMVVVLVLSIGLVGAMNLIARTFIQARLVSSKLAAAYLAQEGMEIVRNIRDTNWIQGNVWDSGIGDGNQQADYNDQALTAYQNSFLKFDNSFYTYDSGADTKFKRRINIQKSADEISVTVTITWDNYEVQAFEKIYKWR